MKQKTARIISLSAVIFLFIYLFSWPLPVSAGESEWSAESIPGRIDNTLGPAGIDIRDYAIGDDDLTIYATPGNSIADTIIYKSTNAGVSWTAVTVSVRADLLAIAPDNVNFIAFVNSSTQEVYLSIDGATTWDSIGTPAGAAVIYDIAISETRENKHYIAVAGKEAGNVANLWYLAYGQGAPVWQGTRTLSGISGSSEVATVAFSPDFASDSTLAAVTDNAGISVQLQLFNISSAKWNSAASYTGYPCTVVSAAGLTSLTSASISLSPTFDGDDDDYRNLYIGLTVAGDATAVAASGIYRFKDTIKTNVLVNTQIHSVAYGSSYVVAGAYNSNTVYRVTSILATTPTVRAGTVTKEPGGENKVLVDWMGSSVTAGTGGNESAFSISKDYGVTFNDISLIDTVLTNATDVAVSRDGKKVYLVTDDGADMSLWRKASDVWSRAFSLKGATDFIVRAERVNANMVYLASKGSTTIYYNSGSGASQWKTSICSISVADIAVESTSVLYVLNDAGQTVKSDDGAISWEDKVDTPLDSGGMLVSISSGKLLAGSLNGYAAYSLDSNKTWTQLPQVFSATAGKIHVIPDENFATNKIIYAASATDGQDIKKWQIGTSTEWTDIFRGTITGGIYGLAIDPDINTLYALEYNSGTGQSTLWRFISPVDATSTSDTWSSFTTTAATDTDDYTVRLNATPQALKTSTEKLWAVKTNGTNKLYSLSDAMVNIKFEMINPQDVFVNHINSKTGLAYDITFSWIRPEEATEYELRIALDEEFSAIISTSIITQPDPLVSANETGQQAVAVVLGPRQSGDRQVDFIPGTTYYWKVRTTKPGYSLFSDVMSFTIEPAIPAGIQLLSPANGSDTASSTPAFSWQPLSGTTEYEFMLSESADMSPPLIDARVDNTGIQVFRTLESGKTYFWRVRATGPTMSEWSALGIFTVAASVPTGTTEPTPAVIELTGLPPQTELVFPPAEPTRVIPGYLLLAIFIMILLVAAVLYLIFARHPERILSAIHVIKEPGRPKGIVKAPVTPREKPGVPTPGQKPVAPATEKTASPPATGKSKEAETVIFAAKSFMWVTEKAKAGAARDKEQETLGKKLAARIKDLAAKEPLHIKHPEDAAMLFRLWAHFGSRNETNHYIAASLKAMPDNAVRFLKCYVLPGIAQETSDPAEGFTRDSYKAIMEVTDPDKVYAALTKIFKFKLDAIEETTPVKPGDRNIAFKFMRLHLQEKP